MLLSLDESNVSKSDGADEKTVAFRIGRSYSVAVLFYSEAVFVPKTGFPCQPNPNPNINQNS